MERSEIRDQKSGVRLAEEFKTLISVSALPLPKNRLQIVCADCLTYMGDKDGEGNTGVSHSLCPACAKKIWDTFEAELCVTGKVAYII
jgi:hypothetical protein